MTPTPEQLAAIDRARKLTLGEMLIIKAFAGAAKTTTLTLIAQALDPAPFLYLAFNKAIAQEAGGKFSKNVVSCTTHALAFAYRPKGELRPSNYRAVEIARMFNVSYALAVAILSNFEEFCNSGSTDIKKGSAATQIKAKAWEFYGKMDRGEIPMTHSFYLKHFHLYLAGGGQLVEPFDYVCLDEGQDTNPVTWAIFKLIPGRKIIVGDQHQSIYAFRGAIDALDLPASPRIHVLALSTTFRCRPQVVDQANWVLSTFKREPVRIVSGNNQEVNPSEFKTKAIISRTNSTLIEYIDALPEFNLTRPPEVMFECLLALYNWMADEPDKISKQYRFLTDFKDEVALKEYIEEVGDLELKQSCKQLARLGGKVTYLFAKSKALWKKNGSYSTTLTTAHSSKGLEFDEVELMPDFPSFVEVLAGLIKERTVSSPEAFFTSRHQDVVIAREEVNLYYVAVTRTKHRIFDQTENYELFCAGMGMRDVWEQAKALAAEEGGKGGKRRGV